MAINNRPYMRDVQLMNDVRYMKDVSLMPDVVGLQDVTPLSFDRIYHKGNRNKYSITTADDTADTLVDLLLSRDSKNNLLREQGLDDFVDIPILSTLAGYHALMKKNYLDPLDKWRKGEYTLADVGKNWMFNSLNEMAEDMDIFSNVVKSQFESAGGHLGFDTLAASVGFNGPRQKYNFNTGNTVLDIALETISDPINWITLGATAVKEVGAQAMVDATKTATRQVTRELSEQAVDEFSKAAVKKTLTTAKQLAKEAGTEITENVMKEALKQVKYNQIHRMLSKTVRDEIVGKKLQKTLVNLIETRALKNITGYRTYLNALQFKNFVRNAEKGYANIVKNIATPAGVVTAATSVLQKYALPAIQNKLIKGMKQYNLEEEFARGTRNYSLTKNQAFIMNQQIHETVFRNQEELLKKFRYNPVDLQTHIHNVITKHPEILNKSPEEFRRSIINSLKKRNSNLVTQYFKDVKYLKKVHENPNADITDKIMEKEIAVKNMEELMDSACKGPINLYMVEKDYTKEYSKATINSLKKVMQSSDMLSWYNYADKVILNYNGTHYGLQNINEFLRQAIGDNNTTATYKKKVAKMLEMLGITSENAADIDKVLKSQTKNKEREIKRIIEKTIDESLISQKEHAKLLRKIAKQQQDREKKLINKLYKEALSGTKAQKEFFTELESKNIKDVLDNLSNSNIPRFKLGDTEWNGFTVAYDLNRDVGMSISPNNVIHINKDYMNKIFNEKLWRKPKNSLPLKQDFKSIEDLYQFSLLHEFAHKYVKADTSSKIINETIVNREALNVFNMMNKPLKYVQDSIHALDLPDLNLIKDHLDLARNNSSKLLSTYNNVETRLTELYTKLDKIKNNKSYNLLADDLRETYTYLEKTLDDLTDMQEALIPGRAASVQINRDIETIRKSLLNLMTGEVKENVANYIDLTNSLVVNQLSHKGMFNVLVQNTHLSNDLDLREVLESLSNKESVERTLIMPKLIDTFEQADMPNMAENLKRVLAQIDTTNNLMIMLSTELPTSFTLSDNTQNILKTMLFDVIDDNSKVLISDLLTQDAWAPTKYKGMLNNVNEILDPVIGSVTNVVESTAPKTYKEQLVDAIHNKLAINEQFIKEKIIKDNPGLYNLDTCMQEIEEQLNVMLDNYINAQAKLMDSIDNISLASLYSSETISAMELTKQLRFALAAYAPNLDLTTIENYDLLAAELQKFTAGIKKGIDEIERINKSLAVPVEEYAVTQKLRTLTEHYNIYHASIESGDFVTKYLISKKYNAELFKLIPENFNGTNDEFILLTNRLASYSDILHETYKYQPEYLEQLKEVLTWTYSRDNCLFAPKDAALYFDSLGPQELLAWETVSKSNLSLNNKTYFYKYVTQNKHIHILDKLGQSDFLTKIEGNFTNTPFIDNNSIINTYNIASDAHAMEYANRVISANFMNTLHDIEDLGKYRDDINKLLKDDVVALDDITKRIINVENSMDITKSYADFGNTEDLAQLGGAMYGYEQSLQDALTEMKYERNASLATWIASLKPDELVTYIDENTPGVLVFHNKDIVRTKHADGSISLEPIKDLFNFSNEDLNRTGLKIKRIENETGEWFYVRLTKEGHTANIVTKPVLTTAYSHKQNAITNIIDDYQTRLNMYKPKGVPTNMITVETLNEDTWRTFIESDLEFFGDIEEQKLYQKITPQGNSKFFNKSFERINLAVVGGTNAYNLWNQSFSNTFIPHSQQLTTNTLSGLTSMINRSNKINKYLTMFFNKDWSLAESPLLNKMFSEADDKRILKFFREGNYKVAVLRADSSNMPIIKEFKVYNRSSLDAAKAAGGILVPRETFTSLRQVVNNRQMTNDLLDIYRRVVPSTYKSFYLYTAGFPFRNGLDSLLYKNMNELGGLEALPDVLKYEKKAADCLKLHNQIQHEVFELSGQLLSPDNETFNKEFLLQVLKNHTEEEAEVYFLTDIFMRSSASGGLSKSMGDFLEKYNRQGVDDIRALWEQIWEDQIIFGEQPLNPLYQMRNLNDHIEQTARMGLFLASVDEGLEIQEAIDRVVKTHFNYAEGGDLLELCEDIFWFSTFPINNFNYYVNGGLTKSPTLFKFALDTQTASWNNGEYTYEQCKKSGFLTYHAMTGNLRIGNFVIKTSPSVFDFLNLVYDGPSNIIDRLNPFLAIPITQDLGELNPMQSQFRLWPQQFQGNPVPSIISKLKANDYRRALGKWRNTRYYGKGWTSYPKKISNRATKFYARKYYGRNYRIVPRKVSPTYNLLHNTKAYRVGNRRKFTAYYE